MTAREHLERTRNRIGALCAPLPTDGANWRGEPGNWTINEILEHLALTERWMVLRILRGLKMESASVESLAETAGKEAFRESRSKTLAVEAAATEEFDRRVFEHPRLGNSTLRQWLLFAAAQSGRHTKQIEKVFEQTRLG